MAKKKDRKDPGPRISFRAPVDARGASFGSGSVRNVFMSQASAPSDDVPNPATDTGHSGGTKSEFCDRLGTDWTRLSDVLGIPTSDQRQFRQGVEGRHIWEWLERRGALAGLPAALRRIERDDLATLLTGGGPG